MLIKPGTYKVTKDKLKHKAAKLEKVENQTETNNNPHRPIKRQEGR